MPHPLMADMLRVLKISNYKKVLAKHQGTVLFAKFVQLSQLLQQIDPAKVQAVVASMPVLRPLYELMMQVAQLPIAPEGQAAGQGQAPQKKEGAA